VFFDRACGWRNQEWQMSLYKVDVPPLVNGGAAGSTGSSPDEGMGNVTTWSGNVTAILYPVPSVEELVILNRLQPEVQRRNNWLERRIVALQAENEKLRAALLRIKETKVFLGAIAQEMMDDALRREEAK
jgi:hypothetical protein